MKPTILLLLLFIVIEGFSIEIRKLSEGILTEKYPNSNKSMIINNGLLYSINVRSFTIFKINNEEFIKKAELSLEGSLYSMDIVDKYAFVTTSFPTNRVYKIDISNVNELNILDTLKIAGSYTGFIFQQKYFVNELSVNNSWEMHIYDIGDFKKYSTLPVPHGYWPFEKLNDDLLTIISNDFIEIYSLKEGKLSLVAKQKVADLSFPRKTYLLNDFIFIHSSAIKGLSIYNISNPLGWEQVSTIPLPITNFIMINDDMFVVKGGSEIRQYDVSDLSNPIFIDSLVQNEKICNLAIDKNNLFVSCKEGKICNYKISDCNMIFQSEYSNYGYLKDVIFYKNNLIVKSCLGFMIRAKIIDNKITVLNEKKDNDRKKYLRNFDENFISYDVLKNSEASKTDICQIKPDGISYFQKEIYNLPDNVTVFNDNLIYLSQGYIKICNFTEPHKLIAEKRFDALREGRFYFHDDHIYLIGFEKGYVFKFDGTNSKIELAGIFNIYNNFYSNVDFYKNYMFVTQAKGGKTCDVYDISDLSSIKFFDAIDYAGCMSVDQENAILFIGDYKCKLFDISDIENHNLKYLNDFRNNSSIIKLFCYKNENLNYLLYVEETSVSLYSYDLN